LSLEGAKQSASVVQSLLDFSFGGVRRNVVLYLANNKRADGAIGICSDLLSFLEAKLTEVLEIDWAYFFNLGGAQTELGTNYSWRFFVKNVLNDGWSVVGNGLNTLSTVRLRQNVADLFERIQNLSLGSVLGDVRLNDGNELLTRAAISLSRRGNHKSEKAQNSFEHACFGQCIQAISDNGPAIIQDILNEEPPTVVCTQLGLCTSKVAEERPVDLKYLRQLRFSKTQKPAAKADPNCAICTFVVGEVEDYIASNATETEIEQALNNACALLGSFQAQCEQLVQDLPAYIAQLEKAEDPTTICTQVGLCGSRPKTHFRTHTIKKTN